jgi:hypothetical protein
MRFRTPNQLHASLYIQEDVKAGRHGRARKNAKAVNASKNTGKKTKTRSR